MGESIHAQTTGIEEEETLETENLEEIEDTTPLSEEIKEEEVPSNETPEESARIALKELTERGESGEKSEEEEETSEPNKQEVKEEEVKETPEQLELEDDSSIAPPIGLKGRNKEWFNKIPQKSLKRNINELLHGMQASMTRATQAARAAETNANQFIETQKLFLDEIAEGGFKNGAEHYRALALSQRQLIDPKTRDQKFKAIGESLGYDMSSVVLSNGELNGHPDIANHPLIKQLVEESRQLKNGIAPILQSRQNGHNKIVQDVTSELESVIYDSDEDGNYKHPKLQDGQFFNAWKQRVSAFYGTSLGKTYREAGVNAYRVLDGKPPIHSETNPTRIPTDGKTKERAASAARSVRGSSFVPSSTRSKEDEVNPNETAEESARIVYENLRRGILE